MTIDKVSGTADDRTLVVTSDSSGESIRLQKCMLLAISGPLQGEDFMVDKDVFTIGSGTHNDLVLRDSTISKHHCQIQVLPEGCLIRDLGSTNGTVVRGVKVTQAFLPEGAEIQLGSTKVIFCPLQESVEYALSREHSFGELLGRSVAMRRVFHLAETYAPTDATILIEGETGTGKEVLAEEMHRHSKRRAKPFSVIDCGVLSRELIESELFGHTKGAFTGANHHRTGAFEHADGGTVFLDEISDLAPDLQPKLLRVLEKREIRRLGSNDVRNIDVRIISATNRKLENEVNVGQFREDLYYRLSVVRIEIPPLRKRKDDIPLLAEKFLQEFLGDETPDELGDFGRALQGFGNHDWPGNVRELRNLTQIAAYAAPQHRPVDLAACLYLDKINGAAGGAKETVRGEFTADRPFKEMKNRLIADFELGYIRALMERCEGNVSRAAREAGIERAYLQRLLKKYGMKP